MRHFKARPTSSPCSATSGEVSMPSGYQATSETTRGTGRRPRRRPSECICARTGMTISKWSNEITDEPVATSYMIAIPCSCRFGARPASARHRHEAAAGLAGD